MIKKLRFKFIAVFMTIVCLFLAGILSALFITSRANYERRSVMALRETAESTTHPRGDRPAMGGGGLPSLLAVKDEQGQISIVKSQLDTVDEAAIAGIVDRIDAAEDDFGLLKEEGFRYFRLDSQGAGTHYALADITQERAALRAQSLHSIVIGLGAALLFFGVSLLLSRLIVGPVETAWNRQRQFVADASHELKTPLTVILSNVDLLIAASSGADEKAERRLDHIRSESRRMRGLVEDLLTLARADSDAEPPRHEPVCLSEIVAYAALTMEPAIYDLGRTMRNDIAENLYCEGDAAKLRQLVDILMDNAGKYSASGSEILVTLKPSGKKELLFRVESQGEPIAQAELHEIFERFYRSDQSRGEEKGYGLGLAIAKGIVLEHGGRIWAQTDGVNTNAFFVRLPACAAP